MIRDPSDGSVRETKPQSTGAMPGSEPGVTAGNTGPGPVSGLPAGSTKPEELARLERSREFVRNFHAKKNA